LELHAARAPHEIELELDHLRRAVGVRLGARAGHAVSQAPLERAHALPLQPVDRIAGRMRLRYRRAGEASPPVVVVALRAGEIELALPSLVERATRVNERPGRVVGFDRD